MPASVSGSATTANTKYGLAHALQALSISKQARPPAGAPVMPLCCGVRAHSSHFTLTRDAWCHLIDAQEFCEQRLHDASTAMLSTSAVAREFCKPKVVRRGSIANGKLDGTALAGYWNLEKAPSTMKA